MNRIHILFILFIVTLSSTYAQDIKKAYKAFGKGDISYARTLFGNINPSNSASEYGLASVNFRNYLFKSKKSKNTSTSKYNKYNGIPSLVSSFSHICVADSLPLFKDEKILKKIEEQYSEIKIKEFKKQIFETIITLNDMNFTFVYKELNKYHSNILNSEHSFKKKIYNRYTKKEFVSLKEKLKKSRSNYNITRLKEFINTNQNWENISLAIDLQDSIYLKRIYSNSDRIRFLKNNPNSKYFGKVKSDYLKKHKARIINNFVLKKSNTPDEFVDSIVKDNKSYRLYIRNDFEIKYSNIKEKYFLCSSKKLHWDIFKNIDQLKIYQSKNPDAFICRDKYGSKDGFTIFSKNKVYKNGKLLSKDYEAIILIKTGWEKEPDSWEFDLKDSLTNENVKTRVISMFREFDNVKVKRNETSFTTSLNLSKWVKSNKEGGIMFVKSGKNSFIIKYPACLKIGPTVENAKKYFNK